MEISRDEYDMIVGLLRAGREAEAVGILKNISNTDDTQAAAIIEQITNQENIPRLSSNTISPSAPQGLRNKQGNVGNNPKDNPGQDDLRSPLTRADHITSASGLPLVIGGIGGAVLAVICFFATRLFLKEKEMNPVSRWSCVATIIALTYLSFIIFFSNFGTKSPYASWRSDVASTLPSSLEDPGKYEVVKNGYFQNDSTALKIIAIGFHESATQNTNIAYVDPNTGESMDYPIVYEGIDTFFEKVITTNDAANSRIEDGRVVHSLEGRSYRSHRLLRLVYATDDPTYISHVSVVERKTKRLVTSKVFQRSKKRGKGVAKVDLPLKNWHASEWDVYCHIQHSENDSLNKVKFELPLLDIFEANEEEDNLFEMNIPYYKLRGELKRDGGSIMNNSQHFTELDVPVARALDELAQMVMFSVADDVKSMKLGTVSPRVYENVTPYLILKDISEQIEGDIMVNEKNQTISVDLDP